MPRVRVLEQPEQWLLNAEPTLSQKVYAFILGPLVDDDVESVEIEEEGAPAYASPVPETSIEVFWRFPSNGIPQVYWIEEGA